MRDDARRWRRWVVCSSLVALGGLIVAAGLGFGCSTSNTRQRTGGGGPGPTAGDAGEIDENPTSVGNDSGKDATPESFDVSPGEFDGEGRTVGEVWEPDSGDFILKDEQTGSLWNMRGEAYAGPLEGAALDQVPAFNSFWFAWSLFYDGSLIWRANEENLRNEVGELDETGYEMGCAGKDCIPALDHAAREFAGRERPKEAEMVEPGAEGTGYLDARELVAGVVVNGKPRAYPLNVYTHHEIHNDIVDGREFTMTFCPLTGSAIPFDGVHEGEAIRFGVSGRLLESNLVMFDPGTDTFWSQLLGKGIRGEHKGDSLGRIPVVETTWERWKELYPNTLVTSSKTGYDRDYNNYLYGDYRTNHDDTFGASSQQDTYEAKKRVLGLPAVDKSKAKVFPFPELEELDGDRNVIHATFKGKPIAVVWESEHQMAVPYWRMVEVDGETRELTFVGKVAE